MCDEVFSFIKLVEKSENFKDAATTVSVTHSLFYHRLCLNFPLYYSKKLNLLFITLNVFHI